MTQAFYTASDARLASIGRTAIRNEINLIESMVMDAVETGGAFEVVVGPGSVVPVSTGFTNSAVHYAAFSDPIANSGDQYRVARRQMDDVIGHFSRLGYNITRAQHNTSNTFNWTVKW